MKETPQQKYQRLVNEIQELVQEVDTIQVSETLNSEIVASVLCAQDKRKHHLYYALRYICRQSDYTD